MPNDLVEVAIEFALQAHEGQLDKGGMDFVLHPLTVASLVEGEEEMVVALLHDVLEKSEKFEADDFSAAGIPDECVEAVEILTKKEDEGYYAYLERVKSNELATKVKLADLKHNCDISRIKNPSDEDKAMVEKYLEYIEFLKAPSEKKPRGIRISQDKVSLGGSGLKF